MSHFAEISGLSAFTLTTEVSATSGIETVTLSGYQATVERVIVAEQEFIDSWAVGSPQNWIQCSYTNSIRNMYPGPGYIYESVRDIFYPPQPYNSWKLQKEPEKGLDENNNIVIKKYYYNWYPPTPRPTDGGNYFWNESSLTWDIIT